jgi:ferric-dicitrate binding protein FerR (iron transport regulator)
MHVETIISRYRLFVTLLLSGGLIASAFAAYCDREAATRFLRAHLSAFTNRNESQGSATLTLGSGNAVSVTKGGTTVEKITPEDVAQRLKWATTHPQEDWLTFNGETLGQVVGEFNRHNQRQLAIADAAISRLRIGGKFHSTDIDGFLATLEETHGVRVTQSKSADGSQLFVLREGSTRSENALR